MTTKTQSVAVRFLPSLTDVAFILPLLFQFKRLGGASSLLNDGDTGWHLRTGEWILAHGRVPYQDMFSYTNNGKAWYAWEWLWDLCFGFLHSHFGIQAVVAASLLLLCCTSALLYRLVLRKCSNVLIAIAVTFLANAGSSIHWLARPHLFTVLFAVIFLDLLDRACTEGAETYAPPGPASRRLIWLLPVLTVVWTNLHGGFVAGLILIGAYVSGGVLRAMLEPAAEVRRAVLARVKPFFVSGVLCALATLVNPYFTGLHQHIFKYLLDPYLYEHISEFMAFNFAHPASKYIELLIFLSAAAACWNLYHKRLEYFVLLAGWIHLGLQVRRNIPLFCVICAPIVAEAMASWLQELEMLQLAPRAASALRRIRESAVGFGEADRLPRIHLASVAAIVLVTALFYAPNPPKLFRAVPDPKAFPVDAASVLLRDGDDHIFSTDVWGGYLIYRLYPQAKVFIDGRSDFYGTAFELKFLDVLEARYNWDENLDKYGARTVVVPADTALATVLKENRRWRVVYDDKVALIFRLATGQPFQRVSDCSHRSTGETCGQPAADAAISGDSSANGSDHSGTNIAAGISPPRLPLLN